jgi:hypothetical protein
MPVLLGRWGAYLFVQYYFYTNSIFIFNIQSKIMRPSRFVILNNFIDDSQISACLKTASNKREHESKVGIRVARNKKIRKDCFFSESDSLVVDKALFDRLLPIVHDQFGIKLANRETYKVGTYTGEEGGFYNPHTDTQGGKPHRQISVVVCLTDESEYTGGIFRLVDLKKEFKFDKGDCMVFDSNLLHGVDPVLSGVRKVLISFMWNAEMEASRQCALAAPPKPAGLPVSTANCRANDLDYSDLHSGNPWTTSDNYFFESNDSDILVVTFAGMGLRGSPPTFVFHNFLKQYNMVDKLFLRDLKTNYYMTGLQGETSSYQETIQLYTELIHSRRPPARPYKKIVGLGTSAGGYAAILYGQHLGFDSVIAFSPQTVLNKKKDALIGDVYNAPNTCKRLRAMHTDDAFYQKGLDLTNFIPFRTHVEIHYSEKANKGADKRHALYFAERANCKLFEHPGNDHLVALTLRDNGKLASIINEAILVE